MKSIELIEYTEFDLKPYYGENHTAYRLNVPVAEAFEILGVTETNAFYGKLASLGAKKPFFLVASEQDLSEFKKIEDQLLDIEIYEGMETEECRLHELQNCIISLDYRDIPFEQDGKWGLRCTTGRVVVPPLFDECTGADSVIKANTMAMVGINGKQCLSPRDGSGKLMTSGYDSIKRSDTFAWVKNGDQIGLLDATTAEVLIPCEQDWMAHDMLTSIWAVGKGDKVGFFDTNINPYHASPDVPIFYCPQFDGIDLATGQTLKDGKWGWVLKNGAFVTVAPDMCDVQFYNEYLPLDPDVRDIYFKALKPIPGLKRIKNSSAIQPAKRAILHNLTNEHIEIDVNSSVAESFRRAVERDLHRFVIERQFGNPIHVKLQPSEGGMWNVTVYWEDFDPNDMAFDEAFPLVNACRKIVYSNDGKLACRFMLELKDTDMELAMKFVTALLIFEERKPMVFNELAKDKADFIVRMRKK